MVPGIPLSPTPSPWRVRPHGIRATEIEAFSDGSRILSGKLT